LPRAAWSCSAWGLAPACRSLVFDYLRTGLVPRLPTAVLATGLALAAMLALACGLILDSLARGRKEMKRLAYLAVRR
jgi:hypothetical protein